MLKKTFPLLLTLLVGLGCTLTTSRPQALIPTLTAAPLVSAPAFIATSTFTPSPTFTAPPSATPAPAPLRFAVIGDFGSGDSNEGDVAALVKGWQPDFVITVGDNNYPDGSQTSIDANVGQYYAEFISPYQGQYGSGGAVNRFFPTLGNHDWNSAHAQPYLGYFTLPGNERYYDFVAGPVHFFALDSDSREPDGVSQVSAQAQWLQQGLEASSAPWQIVYFHHAPYSSGTHGSVDWMRWPFAAWGADAILAGHDHLYERLAVDGIPYFTNGIGGGAIYDFKDILPESQFRFNGNYGAMLVTASLQSVQFQFFARTGGLVDSYTLENPAP